MMSSAARTAARRSCGTRYMEKQAPVQNISHPCLICRRCRAATCTGWWVDPMTIYRGSISGSMESTDNAAEMSAVFGAVNVVPPVTRVSMHDIGNMLADFCNLLL